MRTDDHNNPAAFITDIAKLGGLEEGVDYEKGMPFISVGATYFTARLLGDPIDLTIKVIDKIGFATKTGYPRWTYIKLPKWLWDVLTREQKIKVIGFMYFNEGGDKMKNLFPPYQP